MEASPELWPHVPSEPPMSLLHRTHFSLAQALRL